jgi:predicted DNA-binding transcriptional regulator YafY
MRTATRFPLERIAVLDRAVRAGEYPNARTIGERLEVCRRTVLRDVEFLRDRLGAPIAYDQVRNGYFYTDPNFRLPVVAMSEGELLALVLAERAFQQYRGTPYGPDLARAIEKLARGLDDVVTIDLGELADGCSFRTTVSESIAPEIFRELAAAVRRRHRLVVRYWTPSRDEETTREVDPYHLACIDGRWYLVAYCHARNEVRMFVPSRIRSLQASGETFAPPQSFRLVEYLSGSFGVYRGGDGESHRVRLRFTGEAARYVGDRRWHPSQTVEAADDDALILSFKLSALREIERWALSWGGDCEVLEPRELRDSVRAATALAAVRYARDQSNA